MNYTNEQPSIKEINKTKNIPQNFTTAKPKNRYIEKLLWE